MVDERSRPQHKMHAGVAETHSATVFFLGDRAYKVKKPVDLGFLDFSTVEKRRAACEREVELNQRLAPDVYLGVSSVHAPDGSVCDHLVTMRRMPEERRLSACIDRGEDVASDLTSIAAQIAGLHAAASLPSLTHVATREAVRSHWTDGFTQLATMSGDTLDESVESSIEHLALRYLEGRQPLFEQRIAGGHVRDGHGDLQAEDIFLLDDGPRVLDCLDFDDELRWGDVLLDAGFLAMDLERLGHPVLASMFLADYRMISGGTWPVSLAHHYMAYRAHVRAKVAVIRGAQTGEPAGKVDALQRLCLDHLGLGRVRLILVGGTPGTGKSTLAAALAKDVDAVVIRSDEVRLRTAHVGDRYSDASISAVYQQMLSEATDLLGLGEHVILDATWSTGAHRALARLTADEAAADLTEINCVAPWSVSRARILRRQQEANDPSEATPEVALDMAERFADWPEAHVVATERPLSRTRLEARAACGWSVPPPAE